ncbi:MAG: hypothetical protein ACLFVO_02850 [Chloroflexaceae bacterium]
MRWLRQYRNELFIFLALLFCYVYFLPRWASWNQNSRLNLVLAIVDDGTLNIDNYYQNTGDYALFNGHYYSDKAPGTSFLAVPVYAAARPLLQSAPVQSILERLAQSDAFGETLKEDGTGLLTDKIYFAIVLYLATVSVVALPAALLGVLLYRFLGHFDERPGWRIATALLYGLATNAFPYSGSFFGHQIVAFLLFGAFYLAFLIGQRRICVKWTILVGLMLGYAIITEYPTVLIAGAVFVYTILVMPNRRWTVGLVLSGIPPGLLLMAYNWAIFRTVLPVGYAHSALYQDIHGQGFVSLVGPNAEALWGISFGVMRGLFFVAPILLLALPGFLFWWRQQRYRLEWGVCIWAVTSFFLFNGSSVMWEGGFAVGPRYLLPMQPFMAVGLGLFVYYGYSHRAVRIITPILGLWSLIVVWTLTIGGQSFPDWTRNPLVDYSLPHVLSGNIARNLGMVLGQSGLQSLLPLVLVLAGVALFWGLLGREATPRMHIPLTLTTDNQQKELSTDV